MKNKTKLALVATGTGLSLIVGGVGVASAATTHSTHVAKVVGGFGINDQDSLTHVLSVLVANGTITQAQSDAIVKEAAAERTAAQAARDANHTAHQTLIATTIGLDWTTIQTRLRAGESLATIAGSKKDALIAALVKEESDEIDQAVTSGRLTSAQATTLKANLQSRITAMISRTGGMGRGMGGFGGGFDRGPGAGMGHMMGGFGGPGSNN